MVIVEPTHTTDEPLRLPANGKGSISMVLVVKAVPQELLTVYTIVSTPAVRPVISPSATEVLPFVEVHTPPVVAFARVIVAPTHTFDGPVMTPAVVVEPISIVFVAVAAPHELDIV